MRLICPKCAAQYEVDASAIPEQGREVQCSACGNIWFTPGSGEDLAPLPLGAPQGTQLGPRHDDNEEDRLAQAISRIVSETPPPAAPAPVDPAAEDPAPVVSPPVFTALEKDVSEAGSASGISAPPAPPSAKDEALPADAAPSFDDSSENEEDTSPISPPRPKLDANILSILREEAERETEARVAEGTLSARTDTTEALATTRPVAPPPAVPPTQTSDLRAEPPLTRAHPAPAPNLPDFSDLSSDAPQTEWAESEAVLSSPPEAPLPDAAAIAATLRPAAARGDDVAAVNGKAQGSGFRTGFLSVILIALIAAALYVFAPEISKTVPALTAALEGYRAAVDALRISLNEKLTEAIALAAKALGA